MLGASQADACRARRRHHQSDRGAVPPAPTRAAPGDLARAVLAEAGVDGDVRLTEYRGHARTLAARVAGGADVVCAWGGDGTVNEVGSVLAFGETALAIVRRVGQRARPRARHSARPARRCDMRSAHPGGDRRRRDRRARVPQHGGGRIRRAHRLGIQPGDTDSVAFAATHASSRASCSPTGRGSAGVTIGTTSTEHRAFLLTIANGPQWGNGPIVAPGRAARRRTAGSRHRRVASRCSCSGRCRVCSPRPSTAAPRSRSGRSRGAASPASPAAFHFDGEPVVSTETELLIRVHPLH